jgi:putative two-component system response regulator
MSTSILWRANLRGAADLRHPQRVRQYSHIIARQMMRRPGLGATRNTQLHAQPDEQFLRLLDLASPLHDIGKQALPAHLLLKPATLSAEEFEIIKTHTTLGARMLQAAAALHPNQKHLPMASQIAATHHEHWDGSGYPNRLSGSDIPLAGRIVAVADVYDALISSRVYKPALSHESANDLIIDGAEYQFDPHVVQAFVEAASMLRAATENWAPARAAA